MRGTISVVLTMLKNLFIAFVFLISLIGMPCKAQYWDWAKQSNGGTGNGVQSAIDDKGNLFVILDAFAGSISYGTQTFTTETILAKHDASGSIVWSYSLNGIRSYAVSSDTSGNVYVCGGAWNGAILHSASNSATITSTGSFDAFLAKYNSNGNLIWVKTWGDTISNDNATTLKTDVNGNTYLSGWESYTSTTPAMHDAIRYFVTKYDCNGNLLWCNIPSWENPAQPYASDLDLDGNYYITGNIYRNNASFGTTTLTVNSSLYTIFIVKYDKNGNLVWAKTDGTNFDESRSISVNNKGYFYLTGVFSNPSTFGSITLNNSTAGGKMFIAKYDTLGNLISAKNENVLCGTGIACDSLGFFVTGLISIPYPNNNPPSTGTLGVGSNAVFLNSPKDGDFFVAKYDDNCNLKWAITPGGSAGQSNSSCSIHSDKKNNCYITGHFVATTKLGTTILYSPYTSINYEAFVLKVEDSASVTTSVQNISEKQNHLTILPNPTGSLFNISFKNETGGNITIKVCDVSGKCIYTKIHKDISREFTETIDLSDIAKGIYFVEILGVGYKETKKLVLQ